MKKVSIITILDNNNFGTFLQAFALCDTIEKLGHHPELVDYCRPHYRFWFVWWRMVMEIKNPLRILSRSRVIIRNYLLHVQDKRCVSKYLSAKTFYSLDDIMDKLDKADVYMTGSDQVWNSYYNNGIDEAFYLRYAPKGTRKVAYGASIGMSSFPESDKKKVKLFLDDYQEITLREVSSAKILRNLGISERKLNVVLDPTFLLNKEQWYKCFNVRRFLNRKYLLVYSVETKRQDAIIDKVARKVAAERGLSIVGVYYGSNNNRIDCCEKNYFRATPGIFLSLMYFADFVVVSSFHGTAFSLNFNKDFYTIMPNRFSARVENLLSEVNLTSRLIQSEQQVIDMKLQDIDWSSVCRYFDEERQKSIRVLNNLIQ